MRNFWKRFHFVKKTVFFRKEGLLLFALLVTSSFAITLAVFPFGQTPQNISKSAIVRVTETAEFNHQYNKSTGSGGGYQCTDGNDGVKLIDFLGSTSNQQYCPPGGICTDKGSYIMCTPALQNGQTYAGGNGSTYTCDRGSGNQRIVKKTGSTTAYIDCPSGSYCYNTTPNTDPGVYSCGVPESGTGGGNCTQSAYDVNSYLYLYSGTVCGNNPNGGYTYYTCQNNNWNPGGTCVPNWLTGGNNGGSNSGSNQCPTNGNRADCNAISGTQYCSDQEQSWYHSNCIPGGNNNSSGGSGGGQTGGNNNNGGGGASAGVCGTMCTGTCAHGGIYTDGPAAQHRDDNFTGQCGQAYYGTDNQWYACTSNQSYPNGWVPVTDGACLNGSIIDADSGVCLTNEFIGNPNQFVCGSTHKEYKCQAGVWVETGNSCGPGSSNNNTTCAPAYDNTGVLRTGITNNQSICGNAPNAGDPQSYTYTCNNGVWSQPQGVCGNNGGNSCPQPNQLRCGNTCVGYSCPSGSAPSCNTAGNVICNAPSPTPNNNGGGGGGGGTNPTNTPVPTTAATSTPVPSNTPTLTPTKTPTPTPTTGPGTPTAIATATKTPTPTNGGGATSTPTISPNNIKLTAFLSILGLGSNTAGGQNNNPVRPTRDVNIQVIDTSGQVVKSVTGSVTYSPTDASYKGDIDLGQIANGVYKIKARFDNTLWKAINGITLQNGGTPSTPVTKLVSGDLNQDNILNLLDYNIMISCYGTKSCDQKTQSDLNVDGKVDEQDLNILYSEFSTRNGD